VTSEKEFVGLFRQLGEVVLAGAGVRDPLGEVVEQIHGMGWATGSMARLSRKCRRYWQLSEARDYVLAAVSNCESPTWRNSSGT